MMRLPLFFAARYLFSKKSVNAINIITAISALGVLVSSAALVIVLSFYNGMENFILSQYSIFSPELRIEPVQGKVFDASSEVFREIRNNSMVKSYSEVLEDKVLVEYDGQQFIGRIKGVEPASLHIHTAAEILIRGDYHVQQDSIPYAIIGAQMQANLQVPLNGFNNTLALYIPRKDINPAVGVNPMEEINTRLIETIGILKFQPGFDDLVITPIAFAKDLLGEPTNVSAVEIYVVDPRQAEQLQKKLQQELGPEFAVKNRQQQNPTLYKTVSSEKWIVFFIVTIIGIIAIFNIIGSLTMLVIDKKQDMVILKSLGAPPSLIQKIFFYEGVFIALLGGSFGIVLGVFFCLLQDKYGFIRTGGASLFDAYPVEIRYGDFMLIFITVILASTIVSYIASRLSVRELGKLPIEDVD